MLKTFALYRPEPPEHYVREGYAVDPELPQLFGCVFPDGTTVIRWMTASRSTAIFPSFADFASIHGHPEYGTRIEWDLSLWLVCAGAPFEGHWPNYGGAKLFRTQKAGESYMDALNAANGVRFDLFEVSFSDDF